MHTRLSIVSICRVSGWGDKLFGFRRDKAVPSPIWPGPTPLTPCCVITPCIADVFVDGVLHSSATVAHRTERDGKDRSATIPHFPRSIRHLWSAPMSAMQALAFVLTYPERMAPFLEFSPTLSGHGPQFPDAISPHRGGYLPSLLSGKITYPKG